MISVIMPYWKRADVTTQTLAMYDNLYKDGFEVILVDDGSHDLPMGYLMDHYPWLKIIQLPKKENALNPCVPINVGFKHASGNVIALTNPEITHRGPVLYQMLEELEKTGENGYVLAACWCEEMKEWHCHPTITQDGYHHQIKQPKGSGFHFMAMLNRSLWEKAGGFDEDYRNGWCYDDPDWVMRLDRAGAKFIIRTDIVVDHIRNGASANWNLPNNKGIYLSKWESA